MPCGRVQYFQQARDDDKTRWHSDETKGVQSVIGKNVPSESVSRRALVHLSKGCVSHTMRFPLPQSTVHAPSTTMQSLQPIPRLPISIVLEPNKHTHERAHELRESLRKSNAHHLLNMRAALRATAQTKNSRKRMLRVSMCERIAGNRLAFEDGCVPS